MIFGVQMVSWAVVLVILMVYFQNRRMELMSTKCFMLFLLTVFFNISAELASLFAIWHIETLPMWVVRLSHQLFIGSLNWMAFFLYLYVDIRTRKQKRYSQGQMLIRTIPLVVATAITIFGDLQYYIGENVRYSYGAAAMPIYIIVAFYMILIALDLIKETESFSRNGKLNMACGITVWIIITVWQYLLPHLLVSSAGLALMALFVYISFENPKEYLQHSMKNVLNKYAFELMLNELSERGKDFTIVSVVITNRNLIRSVLGISGMNAYFQEIVDQLVKQSGLAAYYLQESHINFILNKRADEIKNLDVFQIEKSDKVPLKYFVSVVECPKYAKGTEEIISLLTFIKKKWKKEDVTGIRFVDEKTVDRKAYLSAVERIVERAIREDGLEVFYQPIYSTKQEAFTSAEALVRLKDTESVGFISPELFIPIAEEKGLIQDLGMIVFEQVCRFSSENRLWEHGVEYIEVNLSAIQGVDEQLPELLTQCMNRYGISPSFINLEITETASVDEEEALAANMKELRKAGCHFSMDDFGTGYSNFAKIWEMEFELIKLDKSLLWPCFEEGGEKATEIFKTCVNMVHYMGSAVVSEGVETKEQVDFLKEHQVEYLQGYYFSKPIPASKYLAFVLEKND